MNPTIALMLIVLAVLAVSISILLLLRRSFYHCLNPESRPRRWMLFSLLVLFGVFLLWLVLRFLLPQTVIARLAAFVFGITFFVVGMALKWFAPLIDRAIKRRGWPLR
ncbi:MAG TPA: hypothetical protein VGY31_17260 [Terriglobia bacterium]|nr:hypothetical protein [Terriglobia bacterium]